MFISVDWPDDRQELAVLDAQVHVLERRDLDPAGVVDP
jgi:hypothetical protein